MTPGDTVDVRGFAQLAQGTAVLADHIERGAQAEFLKTADQVATLVRARVPKRSGALAGSVTSARSDDGALVGMGGGLPYAGWIEFGGGHGRPYISEGRYLMPTATDAGPALQRAGETAARTEIRGMRWPRVT